MDAKDVPDAYGTNRMLRGCKGQLWEGGIRVPGLIEWPDHIKQPSATSVPVVTSDIYPTIVDLLNLKVPNQTQPLDGISVLPLIDGRMKERPKPIGFWHHGETNLAGGPAVWMDNHYKLHKLPGNKYELYDIVADISEKSDIAADHPQIVGKMKAELDDWQQSVLRSNKGEDYPEKKILKP
jgi:arylsulfatase A-like enzyme